MTEFRERDLSGSSFEDVNLREASFHQVRLNGATLREVDFTGVDIRAAHFSGVRMRGVLMHDVEISGELRRVVINGVDVAPLVEAELNRREPGRAKMSPSDADGFREGWELLKCLWDDTIERARALPEEALHESVDGEWSFVQTLRHLNFATACWVDRMLLGVEKPWHPLDLPWDEVHRWEGDLDWDRDARPGLDEVLAIRRERLAAVDGVMAALTDELLATEVSQTSPGHPREEGMPYGECLLVVLNEGWEHRRYAERDLAPLTGRT